MRQILLVLIFSFASSAYGAEVLLTWRDNSSGEKEQEIERCAGANCTAFLKVATVGVNVQQLIDTTVAELITYCYRIRASDGTNFSGYSNISCTTTKINSPSNLLASGQ